MSELSKEPPTPRPLFRYEEHMVERMVRFSLAFPDHLPWETLIKITRHKAERRQRDGIRRP